MQPELDEVISRVGDAVARGDSEVIARAAYDLETAAMLSTKAVQEIAKATVRWLSTDDFRKADGAWRILFVLRYDLHHLSDSERKDMFLAMIEAFPYLQDSMSRFIVSELAELFATDWALDAVEAQIPTLDDERRRYVPHALEHIALAATDDVIAARSFDRLIELLEDSAPEVKREAHLSIRRVANSRDKRFADAAQALIDR